MPIIFLTSKDHEQDEIIGLRMGAADYIKKPFSQKLLTERVRTVLRIYSNRASNGNNNNIATSDATNDFTVPRSRRFSRRFTPSRRSRKKENEDIINMCIKAFTRLNNKKIGNLKVLFSECKFNN